MVEAVPQAEAFPTGENGGTRKWFGLCEICAAQHGHAGVNKNPAKSLGENEVAPRHGFEPRFTAPKAAVLPLDDRGMLESAGSDQFSFSPGRPQRLCYNHPGSHSWPAPGAGFKPVGRLLGRWWVRLPLASA